MMIPGLIDIAKKAVCPQMPALVMEHIRTCGTCQAGIRDFLTGFPMLDKLIPVEQLVEGLDHMTKGATDGGTAKEPADRVEREPG